MAYGVYLLRARTVRDQLLEEDDELIGGEDSEDQDHVSEESECSCTEEESDELDADLENFPLNTRITEARPPHRGKLLEGANGYKWLTKSLQAYARWSGQLSYDGPIWTPGPYFNPGPINTAASTFEEFWSLLINDEMINLIVEHTNRQIENVCAHMMVTDKDTQTYHHHTDVVEMRAFIGLLYYSGLWKQSSTNYKWLWDRRFGTSVYRCVMSLARFMFLSNCLRFDDKSVRNSADRLAPIRELWEMFIKNCQHYYTPDNNCTVDEQLLGFRGKCPFRTYIKSKRDRYGLKLICLNDASTSYMYNAIPYLGKTSTPENESVPEYLLREVTKPIHGSKRNITCDNWFTSIPTVERLLEKPVELSFTGTIRKNKPEIPPEMKVAGKADCRKNKDIKYCCTKDLTLLSYTSKRNKVVLVLTSFLHCNFRVINGKPQIFRHYNKYKGATDCFDTLCRSHTVSRRTNRWPMRFFFGMLDQAAVNARILLQCRNNSKNIAEKVTMQKCLQSLYEHLIRPHLEERYKTTTIRKDIKIGISNILGLRDLPDVVVERPEFDESTRCEVCPQKKKIKMTNMQCPGCQRPMCDKHRAWMCVECTFGME